MPRKVRQFINNEIYHLVIRRTGDEPLFIDTDDYYRGIFSIYEFNNTVPVRIFKRRLQIKRAKKRFKEHLQETKLGRGLTPSQLPRIDMRDLFVEILSFCLMPNHIHLLVKQLKERGISRFMQKCGAGYAAYFKNKYGIKFRGHFFQDRFAAIHIKNDEQLRVVFVYIHTNPISLVEPKWKELGITDTKKVIKFLENYKWSSYSDYIGVKNFPSLTERKFILRAMKGETGCKEWVGGWVRHKGEVKKLMETLSIVALD